jgi:hypothetical protein
LGRHRGRPSESETDRGGDCDARSGVRTGTESDDDSVRRAELFLHIGQVFEKGAGIFAIVWPLAFQLDISISPRERTARGGKLKRENFHFSVIAR